MHSKVKLVEAGLPAAAVERGASGARLLSGPIGSQFWCARTLKTSSRGMSVQPHTALVMLSAQARAWVVFGSVASRPFFLASLVPLLGICPEVVDAWDAKLREVLQSCVWATVSDRLWELACPPTKDGGLGVPRLRDRADAIFVATHAKAMAWLPRLYYPKSVGLFLDSNS